MHDDALEDQGTLVELIEEAGWDVTDTELSIYESPWTDDDDPEATVTITARKVYEDDGGSTFQVK